jgi:hypothetical protein
MYSHCQVAKAVQRLPPDPAMLAALALREQQQVCLQRLKAGACAAAD